MKTGGIDFDSVAKAITRKTKMVFLQRSRGYAWRDPVTVEILKNRCFVKQIKNDVVVMCRQLYGEFTAQREPVEAGADIVAGSLIKNPGGGLALSG